MHYSTVSIYLQRFLSRRLLNIHWFICGCEGRASNWGAVAILWWVCRTLFRSRRSWETAAAMHLHSRVVVAVVAAAFARPTEDRNFVGYLVRRDPTEGIPPCMRAPQRGGPFGRVRAISVPVLPAPLVATRWWREKNRGSGVPMRPSESSIKCQHSISNFDIESNEFQVDF